MEQKDIKRALLNINGAIDKLNKKDFKLFFFVADSKGTPIGSLLYTYQIAQEFSELGYNVNMLYAEKEFVGVEQWLGEKYSKLPHFNTTTDNVDISPNDFLFIPELFSNVMTKVKNLPCKKIAILQNFNYLTELIPFSATWETLGIFDCITTTNEMAERLHENFPHVRTYVVRPCIDSNFTVNNKQNLVVNIISKNENDINTIIKPFKWRFPLYNFVTFRYLHGRSREEEAKFLSEGAISVWIDDETDFGFTALEAMACGNIVIGKIPENEPEWITDNNNNLRNNGVWFYKNRECPKILGSVIQTLLYNKVPQAIYDEMSSTVKYYSEENQINDIKTIFDNILSNRNIELETMATTLKNNLEKNKD